MIVVNRCFLGARNGIALTPLLVPVLTNGIPSPLRKGVHFLRIVKHHDVKQVPNIVRYISNFPQKNNAEKDLIHTSTHNLMFYFFLFPLIPVAVYVFWRQDNNKLEDELVDRYMNGPMEGPGTRKIGKSDAEFKEMYMNTIQRKAADAEQKLYNILRAGKGEKKRNYEVDTELYGTKKGVEEKKRQQQQQQLVQDIAGKTDGMSLVERNRLKMARKHQRKAKKEQQEAVLLDSLSKNDAAVRTGSSRDSSESRYWAVFAVGAITALIGFISGGSNPRD